MPKINLSEKDVNIYAYKVWLVNYKHRYPYRSLDNRRLLNSLFNAYLICGAIFNLEETKKICSKTNNQVLNKYPIYSDAHFQTWSKCGGIFKLAFLLRREYIQRSLMFNLKVKSETCITLINEFVDNVEEYAKKDKYFPEMENIQFRNRCQLLYLDYDRYKRFNDTYWHIKPEDYVLTNTVFINGSWRNSVDNLILIKSLSDPELKEDNDLEVIEEEIEEKGVS